MAVTSQTVAPESNSSSPHLPQPSRIMEAVNANTRALRNEILATEAQLQKLKEELAQVEASATARDRRGLSLVEQSPNKWPLSEEEYQRYGRQLIVPDIGIQGQLHLKSSSVLIVGVGGLGCPAAAYIAGAGVGKLGLVDGDTVEVSNLHRQIIHSSNTLGMLKVDSAIRYLKSLNPNIKYVAHPEHLAPQSAEEIVRAYDIVLDCTDNPASRYLISDICVLLSKTLISASALRTDGQLIVLNYPPLPPGNQTGGPCYRCIFPRPPAAAGVVSCGEGGILGPIVGVMGVLQAVEAIKFITQGKLAPPDAITKEASPTSMLLFSSLGLQPFRSVRIRSRRAGCFVCSQEGRLSLEVIKNGSVDYALFCGLAPEINILSPDERVEAAGYTQIKENGVKHLLVDVREKVQFDICHIDGSINVPFSSFHNEPNAKGDVVRPAPPNWLPKSLPGDAPIYVVCRMGNDSQVVVRKLKDAGLSSHGTRWIGDIRGGLKEWKEQVDKHWPEY